MDFNDLVQPIKKTHGVFRSQVLADPELQAVIRAEREADFDQFGRG